MMLPRRGSNCCGMPERLSDCNRVRRCDTFIERELGLWIARNGHEIDPFPVETIMLDIDHGFSFLTITGSFIIDEGILKGLRTLHVSGECFRANNQEDRMRFNVELGAGALQFECLCGIRLFNFKPPIFTLHVDIDYIEAHVDFCYNFSFGLEGVLHKVLLKEAKGMKLWVSGLGFFGWLINPFLKLVTMFCKSSILDWIQDEVEDEINDGFHRFQFPYSFIQPLLI